LPKRIKQQPQKPIKINLLEKVAAVHEGIILTPWDMENGTSIQIGDEIVASEYPNRREYARWDAALKECIREGLIEQRNRDQYVITNDGYNAVESQDITE